MPLTLSLASPDVLKRAVVLPLRRPARFCAIAPVLPAQVRTAAPLPNFHIILCGRPAPTLAYGSGPGRSHPQVLFYGALGYEKFYGFVIVGAVVLCPVGFYGCGEIHCHAHPVVGCPV